MRGGKAPPVIDSRTLKYGAFAGDVTLPDELRWDGQVHKYAALGNTTVSNCTCVAAHQMVQTWTANTTAKNYFPRMRDAIRTYTEITGYSPLSKKPDDGAALLDVLKRWRRHGINTGHRIEAFVDIVDSEGDTKDAMRSALFEFGPVYCGFALPAYVKNADNWTTKGAPAGPDATPYSWTGHAVAAVGYTKKALLVVSWGQIYAVTWDFVEKYMDEAYACLDAEWINRDGKSPTGKDWSALLAAVKAIGTPPTLKERL